MTNSIFSRLTVAVDEDVQIHDASDLLYAPAIRVNPLHDLYRVNSVRSFKLEPQSTEICGLAGALPCADDRYAIDATKPPLSQPQRRIQFEPLTAQCAPEVRLEDFL